MTGKTQKQQSDFITDVSVDCVMFGFHGYQLKVLLLKWPSADGWTLPRGPVRRSEPIMDAALRMLKTTTGLDDIFVQQFQTFSHPGSAWQGSPSTLMPEHLYPSLIAIGFYALVDFEKVRPNVDGMFQWCEMTEVPELLFDHNDLIESALLALRKDLRYLPLAKLLPRKFTLREMQKLYETILNRAFDRRNFHKLLMSYDFLIKLQEKKTGSQNKSPHLYTIDFEKYESALQDGISY
jgi:8-oxo-dGTP diphosphatase